MGFYNLQVIHPSPWNLQSTLKNFFHSSFAISLLFCALINVALLIGKPLNVVPPEKLPAEHGWAWWAAQNLLQEQMAPNIVLVGSSLMMNPIWENEAEFLGQDVDITVNRRVEYLSAALSRSLPHCQSSCFNMALPGAMLSDDYMVVRSMLCGKKKPNIVVLGLSPRDFVDNGFRGAVSSPHYRYLSRFTNTDDLVGISMPHYWQRIGYYLHRNYYLEDKKADLQVLISSWPSDVSNRILGPAPPAKPTNTSANLAIYQSELERGVWIAHPRGADYYHETEFDKLKNRYSQPNRECLENQRRWFDMCLALCKNSGIRTVVVNMPITQTNVDLFAPGVYAECVGLMADEARKFDCPFVDLQQSPTFCLTDFTDMCHMDASGGRKALDHIALTIAHDQVSTQHLMSRQFQCLRGESFTRSQL